MSDENGFDINQIKRCVTTLLPNEVIFALGNSEEVKCASVWIKHLQDRLSEAEKVARDLMAPPDIQHEADAYKNACKYFEKYLKKEEG